MGEVLIHILKSFVYIILPLLLIAALIEGFITPMLLESIL